MRTAGGYVVVCDYCLKEIVVWVSAITLGDKDFHPACHKNLCDHCYKPLGVSVVYDHGKRYHPSPCYPEACKKKLEEADG